MLTAVCGIWRRSSHLRHQQFGYDRNRDSVPPAKQPLFHRHEVLKKIADRSSFGSLNPIQLANILFMSGLDAEVRDLLGQ